MILEKEFENPKAERNFMGKMPGWRSYETSKKLGGRIDCFKRMCHHPSLSEVQQRHLIRQMNYCKWRAKKDGGDWEKRAMEARNTLVQGNMRRVLEVVLEVAHKTREDLPIEEMVSDGTLFLISLVEQQQGDARNFHDYLMAQLRQFYYGNEGQGTKHQELVGSVC